MFEPLLNLDWTLPNLNRWSGSTFGKISRTERKVRFCVRRNSRRTELNRTSASLTSVQGIVYYLNYLWYNNNVSTYK